MNAVELLDHIAALIDLGWPVLYLLFAVLWWSSFPPRSVQQLYPFRMRLLWTLPLSKRWRIGLAPEHVRMIAKFRRRLFYCLAVPTSLALVQALYYKLFFLRLHAIG